MACGGCSHPGAPVHSVYLSPDKRFAFVELRTIEEASNALLALDGLGMQVGGWVGGGRSLGAVDVWAVLCGCGGHGEEREDLES